MKEQPDAGSWEYRASWTAALGTAAFAAYFGLLAALQGEVWRLHLALSALGFAGMMGYSAPIGRYTTLALLVGLVGGGGAVALGVYLMAAGEAIYGDLTATWIDTVIGLLVLAFLGWGLWWRRRDLPK